MASSRIVFLGTGTSERVPRVTCLTKDPPTCPVCTDAVRPGSKNHRRNTSLLVQKFAAGGELTNIVIDAGKSFYEAALQWFPKHGVRKLDAVVLTHAHADAIAGLDDLRDWTNNAQGSIPVYLRPYDMETVSQTHFYLVDRSKATSAGGIAKLEFVQTGPEPFDVRGVTFTPLTVEHGRGVTANGYRIGDVCYVPDTSRIPYEAWMKMQGCGLLILDALRPGRTHGSHLTLEEAVEATRKLKPGRTLLTDMAHDIEHESTNEMLRGLKESEGMDIQLAYDGLCVEVEV
jgi:phosphoribosyl 1,2-cyclic phosphodiesterase